MTSSALTSAPTLRNGVTAAVIAYTMWGFFPFYFKLAHMIPTTEMLGHRIIWSLPFGALIISLRHQWQDVFAALKNPKMALMLGLSAAIIAVNWLVYTWAVQQGRIFEASLGYYINPLIYVVVGVVFLKERLRRPQWLAVALAAIGVSILTIYGGSFPIVSITLAISFTAYGVIRKQLNVGAMPGLLIEVIWLFPLAVAYLAWLTHQQSAAYLQGSDVVGLALLAGPLTVLPLLFFAIGARQLPLSLLGFLQFIGPTLQFFCGLYFGEKFTFAHAWCFGFIWLAVIVFSLDKWRELRISASPKTA